MKVGDILYCIKDIKDDYLSANKGDIYKIIKDDKTDNSYELECINSNNMIYGWLRYTWAHKGTDDYMSYIWKYFETKQRRAKRVIKNYTCK